MNNRRPPIAPKSAQQPIGPIEGQQLVLEGHNPSPRKNSGSEHGSSLGSARPRSPRPADVYSAAMAELTEGDGRGLTKIRLAGPSPASSPGRRRAISVMTMSSVTTLHPLSPGRAGASASSILDHSAVSSSLALGGVGIGLGGGVGGGVKAMTFSGVSGGGAAVGSIGSNARDRVLSALDEHRAMSSQESSLSATAPLPSTPQRKSTSAPDSQSALAQMRSPANPWRSGVHDPVVSAQQQIQHQSPRTAALVAGRTAAPASPPLHPIAFLPVPPPPVPVPSAGAAAHAVAWASLGPPLGSPAPLAPGSGGAAGGGVGIRQQRESTSSLDSPGPPMYDSPSGVFGSSLRVATLSRVGSPNSPSTPASCSQPHTPTCSTLKPRPPEAAPSASRGSSRKLSLMAGADVRQQAQPALDSSPGPGPGHGLGRHTQSTTTTPGATPDEVPTGPRPFRRSLSVGGVAAAAAAAAAAAVGSGGGNGSSQPGTPSASRPNSSRAGSGRPATRPVAALVGAVRSKDDSKLTEMLEALRGLHGVVMGLNERHNVTGRTPLHEAVITNSASMVAMLLAAGADPNIGHLTQGPPLLHSAAFGEVSTMRLLLKEGANVHATDVERSTPLHFACVGGHIEAVRLLLDWGGDLRARNEDDLNPLDMAPPEFARLLLLGGSAGGGQPSPPPGGRLYGGGGGAAAATGSAGGSSDLLVASISDTGVGLAPSPERPSSSVSRPTSGTAATRDVLEAVGGGGGSRRTLQAVGNTGRPPGGGGAAGPGASAAAGAVANGPLSSPTAQIDLNAAGGLAAGGSGGGGLRPAPPMDPGVGGPRSRRNSSGAAAMAAALAAAAAQPSSAASAGNSPLRSGEGGEGAATVAPPGGAGPVPGIVGGGRYRGPAIPQVAEAEAAPASPPRLQLPGGVRRQLSRGVDFGDIISSFKREDEEIVRKSTSGPAILGIARLTLQAEQEVGGAAEGQTASPSQAKLPSVAHGVAAPAAAPAAAAAPPTFGLPPGMQAPQPQHQRHSKQPLVHFKVPETSVICFGTRVQVHGPTETDTDIDGQDSDAGGGNLRPLPSGTVAMPSFSAGLPDATAVAAAGGPTAAGGAAVVAPVTPDQLPPPQVTVAAGSTAAVGGGQQGFVFGAVGFKPVPATGFTPAPGAMRAGGGSGGGEPAARRMSGSADDLNAGTPPLVRDSSPVRDRASTDGTPAGGGAGGGGCVAASRHAPTRTSHLAAQALLRMSNINNTNTSMEAIGLRAAALFRQSTNLTTGGLEWTRGELLGEGAYGKVYAGLNQQTGELMAVKELKLVSKHGDRQAVFNQLESLEHEMSLYKKLKHKHVVGYIDAQFDPKTFSFYIFLEYVPGGSIASMLTRFGRFSEDLVRNYTRQLLMGLEYLHGCKIVHRDLKGANVLVTRDGVVKLADFGASKAYRDQTITDVMKSVRGSVFWMAPEVIRGTGYGRRADIWSLGCLVIEMLTGTHPWPHLDNALTAMFAIAKTEEGPPRPRGMSAEAARFLDKCLQFDPSKRPTATELLQDPFVARMAQQNGEDKLQHSF